MITSGSGYVDDRTTVDTAVVTPFPRPRTAEWAEARLRPTIGIITAIPEEFAAVRALLDGPGEHDVDEDPAPYVLGSLPSRDPARDHYAALTLLGATATNAAANGCTNLVRSFPSVVTVVMAGVAAGIPNPYRPQRHVRLGDIVVATHGLVDYDHIRSASNGVQPRRPFPLPSTRLVRCANMLKADELTGFRPWEHWLGDGRPQNLFGYGRPPHHTDVLQDQGGFRLQHPNRNLSGHRKGYPKVHYGAIGSADRSLYDAATRDQLAERHGFLAVEMEGAGIGSSTFLNNLEWFVIRGISDYGDENRSEVWRRHASLAAACYLRALLSKCPPLESHPGRVPGTGGVDR
jgi:nucleoside phosphorylase